MTDRLVHLFGKAPWPIRFGNPSLSNVSPARVTAKGQPLWSLPLPERGANGIRVAADGRCFVALDHRLLAVSPAGQLEWSIELDWLLTPPTLLADGQMLVCEAKAITIREQITGRLLATLPVKAPSTPALTPEKHLIYDKYQAENNVAYLHAVTWAGEHLWSQMITHPVFPPTVFNDLIILGDGSYLRAYNFQGSLLWIANQTGFQVATPDNRAQLATLSNRPTDRVSTPVIGLDSDRVLAGLCWYTGLGYYIFDVHAHTVQPLGKHLPLGAPFAVPVLPDRGPCLVTNGWHEKNEEGEVATVLMVDLKGQLVWKQRVKKAPHTIIADADNKILMAASPSFDRWDKYRQWYHLEEQCFVRGWDSSGRELFTWFAPGPISPAMAVGQAGELYVVADGQLWALS